jgi:predicted nucleic acid-binding protein
MFLVDTNILSEARRGRPEARDWLRSVDADQVYLSVVTLGEIMKGIRQKARSDAAAAASLEIWLHQLSAEYAHRILPIDNAVALEWGRIAARRSRDMADALIAATATVHRKVLVTRNVGDFRDIDVPLINPWNIQA